MAVEFTVEGPAWSGEGLDESAGRYPLRVEGAVFRLVQILLPGIITTTRHARMYALHALAWPEAESRGLTAEEAAGFVRRCEVALTAVSHFHSPHRRRLSVAHGEDELPNFVSGDVLDLKRAAEPGGMSANGFGGVYIGPCIGLGLLSPDQPPRQGERSEPGPLREALGELLDLADRDEVPLGALQDMGHLCLCNTAEGLDGEFMRRLLFEAIEEDRPDDLYRQLTMRMFLESIRSEQVRDVTRRFQERWGFGGDLGDPDADQAAFVAWGWRVAILRNCSVGAWRALWQWLARQLRDPMTAEQLGARLAEELGEIKVSDLIDSLPQRIEDGVLLPAELEIESEEWSPLQAIRMLALGAKRLDDLEGPMRMMFIGTDPTDLGPEWVNERLHEWRAHSVRHLADELTAMLIRRAKRVSLSKMRLVNGRPWVPTRLRDRDGLLSVHGEEGAGSVSLRTSSLNEVSTGLGLVDRNEDWETSITPEGEQLYEQLG